MNSMISKLDIEVQSIKFPKEQEDEVQIYFTTKDESRRLNLDGFVPATLEEYEHKNTKEGLSKLVKEKLIGRIGI